MRYGARILIESDSVRMEPVTVFVLGGLLLVIGTSLRLRIMRRADTEAVRSSRNAHPEKRPENWTLRRPLTR